MGIVFNPFTGQFTVTGSSSGGSPSNSFETMQVPSGTSPVATSSHDTLTFASDGTITIVGNSGTDTITLGTTGLVHISGDTMTGALTVNSNITATGILGFNGILYDSESDNDFYSHGNTYTPGLGIFAAGNIQIGGSGGTTAHIDTDGSASFMSNGSPVSIFNNSYGSAFQVTDGSVTRSLALGFQYNIPKIFYNSEAGFQIEDTYHEITPLSIDPGGFVNYGSGFSWPYGTTITGGIEFNQGYPNFLDIYIDTDGQTYFNSASGQPFHFNQLTTISSSLWVGNSSKTGASSTIANAVPLFSPLTPVMADSIDSNHFYYNQDMTGQVPQFSILNYTQFGTKYYAFVESCVWDGSQTTITLASSIVNWYYGVGTFTLAAYTGNTASNTNMVAINGGEADGERSFANGNGTIVQQDDSSAMGINNHLLQGNYTFGPIYNVQGIDDHTVRINGIDVTSTFYVTHPVNITFLTQGDVLTTITASTFDGTNTYITVAATINEGNEPETIGITNGWYQPVQNIALGNGNVITGSNNFTMANAAVIRGNNNISFGQQSTINNNNTFVFSTLFVPTTSDNQFLVSLSYHQPTLDLTQSYFGLYNGMHQLNSDATGFFANGNVHISADGQIDIAGGTTLYGSGGSGNVQVGNTLDANGSINATQDLIGNAGNLYLAGDLLQSNGSGQLTYFGSNGVQLYTLLNFVSGGDITNVNSISNGYGNWAINNDGSGGFSASNISWDSSGNISASSFRGTGTNIILDAGSGVIDTQSPIKPVHIADSSAPNDSVYFSTTSSKLVYKDSGGTVNALY